MIDIPIGITSSAIELKVFAITAEIKKYKSIIKKKKKKHIKIVLLAKSKLNSIEILISKTLIDSGISYDEFVLINNVVKEYNEKKKNKKFKDLILSSDLATRKFVENFSLSMKQCYCIVWSVEKIQKVNFFQNVQCVIVKNQDLSNSNELVDY